MKIFFDTNVYIAEALLGRAAEQMLDATVKGSWRIYTSRYVGEELERVLTEALDFSRRLAVLSRRRVLRRAKVVEPRFAGGHGRGSGGRRGPPDRADPP